MMNDGSFDRSQLMGSVGQVLSKKKAEVLVLGLGESGLAIAKWLLYCGYPFKIADTRLDPPNARFLWQLDKKIRQTDSRHDVSLDTKPLFKFYFGWWHHNLLENIKLVAISPGLSIHDPVNSRLLSTCHAKKIPVWGEFEFFSCALRILAKLTIPYIPKVLAVTGTNGKTTVCKLLNHLLKQSSISTALAGNIGPALIERLRISLDMNVVDGTPLPEVWIIEASSFQLVSSHSFQPDAAALLNVTQDHLDWHQSFDEYSDAKRKIFACDHLKNSDSGNQTPDTSKKQTLRILCRDDMESMEGYRVGAPCVTVGSDLPQRVGDYGVFLDDTGAWLVCAEVVSVGERAPHELHPKESKLNEVCFPVSNQLQFKKLIPVQDLQIFGQHNICNALSALALACSIDSSISMLLNALRTYKGEPHRMELVGVLNGVRFIDDSKATNVGATLAALKSFCFNGPYPVGMVGQKLQRNCLLIAGGDGKDQDFSPLSAPISQSCRGLFLIGRDASKIANVLDDKKIKIKNFYSLEKAVMAAASYARTGDVVLLSPACASLDMFRNYEHRGEVFRNAVLRCADR